MLNYLGDLRTGPRLMLGFGLVLVLMGVLAVNAWRNLGKVQQVGEISTLVSSRFATKALISPTC